LIVVLKKAESNKPHVPRTGQVPASETVAQAPCAVPQSCRCVFFAAAEGRSVHADCQNHATGKAPLLKLEKLPGRMRPRFQLQIVGRNFGVCIARHVVEEMSPTFSVQITAKTVGPISSTTCHAQRTRLNRGLPGWRGAVYSPDPDQGGAIKRSYCPSRHRPRYWGPTAGHWTSTIQMPCIHIRRRSWLTV